MKLCEVEKLQKNRDILQIILELTKRKAIEAPLFFPRLF